MAQARAVNPVIRAARLLFAPYRERFVSNSMWLQLLQLLFEVVRPASVQAASNAREFYDSERAFRLPGFPRQDTPLIPASFESFVKDMEPARKLVQKPFSSVAEIDKAAMQAARVVEMAGRRTIIHAVQDPDPVVDDRVGEVRPSGGRLVRGWARIPTGRETCGFCWMLCSRGADYRTMEAAGVKSGNSLKEMLAKHRAGGIPSEDMEQWHTGCDCKVVPVWDFASYPGKEKSEAAAELWYDISEGRYSGDNKRRSSKEAYRIFREAVREGVMTRYLADQSLKAA